MKFWVYLIVGCPISMLLFAICSNYAASISASFLKSGWDLRYHENVIKGSLKEYIVKFAHMKCFRFSFSLLPPCRYEKPLFFSALTTLILSHLLTRGGGREGAAQMHACSFSASRFLSPFLVVLPSVRLPCGPRFIMPGYISSLAALKGCCVFTMLR